MRGAPRRRGYDLTEINVLQIILSNGGCRIGVNVGIRETNIT